MERSECLICCEKLNKTVRKAVECRYCNFIACMTCCKKDALEVENPRCMNCNKIWYGDDIKFPKSFIDSELRAHVTDFIYEYEKSLFADTMTYFKLNRAVNINKFKEPFRAFIDFYEPILMRVEYTGDFTLINSKFDTIAFARHLQNYYDMLLMKGSRHDLIPLELCGDDKTREISTAPPVHIACSAPDCVGYLDAKYKCGICKIKYCNKCRNCLVEGHICNADDIASLKLILTTTKKCPSCATAIHKIEGCDQMFCVLCKTAFSYKSGRVITGQVHNPHYFDWLNSRHDADTAGGNLQAGRGCDNMGDIYTGAYYKLREQVDNSIWSKYKDIFEVVCYPVYNMRFSFNRLTATTVKPKSIINLHVRDKYLNKTIDLGEFKRQCYINVRQNMRNEETAKIIEVIKLMHEDLLINIINTTDRKFNEQDLPTMKSIEVLSDFIDELVYLIHDGLNLMKKTAENFNKNKLVSNQIRINTGLYSSRLVRYKMCFGWDAYALVESSYM